MDSEIPKQVGQVVVVNRRSMLVKAIFTGEYLYKPWAFDTILIYLYMCVIVVSVNISE